MLYDSKVTCSSSTTSSQNNVDGVSVTITTYIGDVSRHGFADPQPTPAAFQSAPFGSQ